MEDEANAFALELLIPTKWLLKDISKIGTIDIEDDDIISRLAKRYRVSNAAMIVKILGLRNEPTEN